ncbi:MAG: LON peptidase substrate-binding domain-containing protein [Vicinamibacterales bacterium]
MTDLLPIFPLPSVVLFPGVFLPLHIFEPRYREMVSDALETDRLIGMALLRPGWEGEYEGRPPVFEIGCSAVITHCERLDDGRFNIILRGLDRFRIVSEDDGRSYRRVASETLHEPPLTHDDRVNLGSLRARIEGMLATADPEANIDPRMLQALNDADLVNTLSQFLNFDPLEKQALLETPSATARARELINLLEMRMMMARGVGMPGTVH